MVDTLKLYWPEGLFAVAPDNALTVQPASYRNDTGEVIGSFPLWPGVEARKAHLNADNFNLDIQSGFDGVGLHVHLSLPGYAKANNLEPVDRETASDILTDVRSKMKDAGVSADIGEARLSRLDIFKNVLAEHPFQTYQPVLQLLDAKRMRNKKEFGNGEGFTWGSNRKQICAYDKVLQMTSQKKNVSAYQGKNVLRFEQRFFRPDTISNVTGMFSGKDLLQDYNSLEELYCTRMRQNLFRFKPSDIEVLNLDVIEDTLRTLKKFYPRTYLSQANKIMGMKGWTQYGNLNQVASIVEKVSGHRNTRRRWVNSQKKTMLLVDRVFTHGDVVVPIGTLYEELMRKVA